MYVFAIFQAFHCGVLCYITGYVYNSLSFVSNSVCFLLHFCTLLIIVLLRMSLHHFVQINDRINRQINDINDLTSVRGSNMPCRLARTCKKKQVFKFSRYEAIAEQLNVQRIPLKLKTIWLNIC